MIQQEFYTGKMFDAYEYFGAKPLEGKEGFRFCVYAPNANAVEVIGEFNAWGENACYMKQEGQSGVYEYEDHCAREGMMYKYRIHQRDGRIIDRADPYGFSMELRPGTASILTNLNQDIFSDQEWLQQRKQKEQYYNKPLNIYEIHVGSWKKKEDGSWYQYDELADQLIPYLKENNYTHVELLPLSEHPLDASWGYQVSGFYAPTSRYGTPIQLMQFVNRCHQNQIGVILDFVPVHFVVDEFALGHFDGTALYEYPDGDTRVSEWGSNNFNYYRGEVRTFLQSAANYWLTKYHIDGLRMDAISNALYWQGQQQRGVNSGAVEFIQHMNQGLKKLHADVLLIAEDSTNFPKVTAPPAYGGLGFDYKWDMGWMNDTLAFFKLDPIYRKNCYGQICFSMNYFQNELYLMPLSHDEVVHGKKTILDKMWGSYEEKFAQCRTLYLYMYTHPGKKLDFMGNEFGQFREWDEDREQDFLLLQYPMHDAFFHFRRELSRLYLEEKALHEGEYNLANFEWIPVQIPEGCVYAYLRKNEEKQLLIVMNVGNIAYERLAVQLPEKCRLKEIFNTDSSRFGGNGIENNSLIEGKKVNPIKEIYEYRVKLAPFASTILEIKARI